MNHPLSINSSVHDIMLHGTKHTSPARTDLQAVFDSAMAGKRLLSAPFQSGPDMNNFSQEDSGHEALPESAEKDRSPVTLPAERQTPLPPAAGYSRHQPGQQTAFTSATENTLQAQFLQVSQEMRANTAIHPIPVKDNLSSMQHPDFLALCTPDRPVLTSDNADSVDGIVENNTQSPSLRLPCGNNSCSTLKAPENARQSSLQADAFVNAMPLFPAPSRQDSNEITETSSIIQALLHVAFPTKQETPVLQAASHSESQPGQQTAFISATEGTLQAQFLQISQKMHANTAIQPFSVQGDLPSMQRYDFSDLCTSDRPVLTSDNADSVDAIVENDTLSLSLRLPCGNSSYSTLKAPENARPSSLHTGVFVNTMPLFPVASRQDSNEITETSPIIQALLHVAFPTKRKTPLLQAAGHSRYQSGQQITRIPATETTLQAQFLQTPQEMPANIAADSVSVKDNLSSIQGTDFSALYTPGNPVFIPHSTGPVDTTETDFSSLSCADTPLIRLIEELTVQIHTLITRQGNYVQYQFMMPVPGMIAINISIHAGELQVAIQAPHEIQKQLIRSQHELLARLQRRHPAHTVTLDFDNPSCSLQDANQHDDLPDAGKDH